MALLILVGVAPYLVCPEAVPSGYYGLVDVLWYPSRLGSGLPSMSQMGWGLELLPCWDKTDRFGWRTPLPVIEDYDLARNLESTDAPLPSRGALA